MTRLKWDAVGKRFYETGVDRGVLYAPFINGVAWMGLISVSESPTGGDAKPYYLDGIKYINLSTAEEFEATLVSFYYPPEFNVCDGVATVHTGLFATQQKRQSFGFSYRTRLGNDLKGSEYGYKIHLVYNALANPASRDNNTMNDEIEPSNYSWHITTLPPAMTGFKPTAHLVIDSTLSTPANLTQTENLLYGTDSTAARLPSPDELAAIFAS